MWFENAFTGLCFFCRKRVKTGVKKGVKKGWKKGGEKRGWKRVKKGWKRGWKKGVKKGEKLKMITEAGLIIEDGHSSGYTLVLIVMLSRRGRSHQWLGPSKRMSKSALECLPNFLENWLLKHGWFLGDLSLLYHINRNLKRDWSRKEKYLVIFGIFLGLPNELNQCRQEA